MGVVAAVVGSKTEYVECYYLPRDKVTLDRFAKLCIFLM